jgi:DNA mismatch endonuclease (patch repair protein)
VDVFSKKKRSEVMSRIRDTGTRPEQVVRGIFRAARLRCRLHASDLPGRPDFVLPELRTVVFVHGCFWHCHRNCRYATTPSSNRSFWRKKLARNVQRDAENETRLLDGGWRVLTVWECAIRDRRMDVAELSNRMIRWIDSPLERGVIPRVAPGRAKRRVVRK